MGSHYCVHLLLILLFSLCRVTPVYPVSTRGNWEKWSSWSECSVTCGFGKSTRYRVWSENGKVLDFIFRDIRECWIQAECPVHGSWGLWGDWDSCTAMCDSGTHRRARVCNSPVPHHGGSDCRGAKWEMKECNKLECPKIPPGFRLSSCTIRSHFICESQRHCVKNRYRCDGQLDCHDGSDERNCLVYYFGVNGSPSVKWNTILILISIICSCHVPLILYIDT